MIKLNNSTINITIFPDKTSQCWKLEDGLIKSDYNKIIWDFENESEFMHLAQLCTLLKNTTTSHIALDIPYFPYARQDKEISNESTFALRTFCKLLDSLEVNLIKTFDIHSSIAIEILKTPFINLTPEKEIASLIEDSYIDLIIYPDKGAKTRYNRLIGDIRSSIAFEKIRVQSTGIISGLKADNEALLEKSYNVLVVDDLCDGGMTFIKIAEYILKTKKEVCLTLYTSHGIYSRGTKVLFDSGYHKIFNKDGEIKNENKQ